MDIKILFEDENFLIVDKPSGIAVHPAGKTEEYVLTDWVLEKYPEMADVGEPLGEIKRPGVVHRLDKETSGVLVLAKNQAAHQSLKNQFQKRKVKKVYVALVSGFVKEDFGTVDKPIGRSPSDFRRRLAGRGARGELREAVTNYKVLKRFEDKAGNKFTCLEVMPQTGRTHQIRVHMKYLSRPVVCDKLYDPQGFCPPELGRLALHAKSIEFKCLAGEDIKAESPVPAEFAI